MIDPSHAKKLWENLLIHDDGICGTGGTFCDLIGAFGHGKSTLLMQCAQLTRSLPYGVSKHDLRKFDKEALQSVKTDPEMVILRGMSDDHWNCLIPKNWRKSFPKYGKSKPLMVHVHDNDDYTFTEVSLGKKHTINNELTIKHYKTPQDLLDNLRKGGINVVYEPSEYFLGENILKTLAQQELQGLKEIPSEGVLAPPPSWWFEFCNTLLEETQGRHVTIILDELHTVTPSYPAGKLFHLTGNFAKSMIHFRKNNISVFGSTHDDNLLDYRVKERLPIRVWFPGSLPKNSMVQLRLLRSLDDVGQAIIEEQNIEFGVLNFDKIPNQPPILKAKLIT